MKIPSLNGLRAVSIVMVIGYHLDHNNFLPDNAFVHYISMAFLNGPLGVNVFFIISGFLITLLLKNEEAEFGEVSLKNFYLRRVVRIFPAYYFLLFVYFLLQRFDFIYLNSYDWLGSITFTKQFFKTNTYEVGHLWSLSAEEVFYLVWPVFFVKYKRLALPVVLLITVLMAIMRIWLFEFPAPYIANTIFSTGDALLIGCLIAMRYEEVVEWVSTNRRYVWLVLGSLLLSTLLYKFLYNTLIKSPENFNLLLSESVCYGLIGSIGLITNCLLAFLIVYSINVHNVWFRLMNSAFLNHIGKLSYSIYLWQQLLVSDREFFHRIPVPVLLVLIYLTACFSYYLIEKPFLKLKHRYSLNKEDKKKVALVA